MNPRPLNIIDIADPSFDAEKLFDQFKRWSNTFEIPTGSFSSFTVSKWIEEEMLFRDYDNISYIGSAELVIDIWVRADFIKHLKNDYDRWYIFL